jgi:hypothetical protein
LTLVETIGERSMSRTAKTVDNRAVQSTKDSETDVLHFLDRTLRAHIIDTEPKIVLEKLQNLQIALEQQEVTLSDWPDSPSKDRICAALAKAKDVISQIVADFGIAAPGCSATRAAKAL